MGALVFFSLNVLLTISSSSFVSSSSSNDRRVNECRVGRTYTCCPGWMREASSGRCTIPWCTYGCGSGRCVRPNICLCKDGSRKIMCRESSVKGEHSIKRQRSIKGQRSTKQESSIIGRRSRQYSPIPRSRDYQNPDVTSQYLTKSQRDYRRRYNYYGNNRRRFYTRNNVNNRANLRERIYKNQRKTTNPQNFRYSNQKRIREQNLNRYSKDKTSTKTCNTHAVSRKVRTTRSPRVETHSHHDRPYSDGRQPTPRRRAYQPRRTPVRQEKGCEKLTCAHTCRVVEGRPRCLCRSGYRLARDHTNCFDVNECLERRHRCDHSCLNNLGSYRCACYRGYRLAGDGRKCISLQPPSPTNTTRDNSVEIKHTPEKIVHFAPNDPFNIRPFRRPTIHVPYKTQSLVPFKSQNVNWVMPNIPELALTRYNNVNIGNKQKNSKISYNSYKTRNKLFLPDHPENLVRLILEERARDKPMYVPKDVVDEILARNDVILKEKQKGKWKPDSNRKTVKIVLGQQIAGKRTKNSDSFSSQENVGSRKDMSTIKKIDLKDEPFIIDEPVIHIPTDVAKFNQKYRKSDKKRGKYDKAQRYLGMRGKPKSNQKYPNDKNPRYLSDEPAKPVRKDGKVLREEKTVECRGDLCVVRRRQFLECPDGIVYMDSNGETVCKPFLELQPCKPGFVIVVVASGTQCFPDSTELLGIECSKAELHYLKLKTFGCLTLSPGGIIPAICSPSQIARKVGSMYVCKDDANNSGCPENFSPISTFEGVICNHNERCPAGSYPALHGASVHCKKGQLPGTTTTTISTTITTTTPTTTTTTTPTTTTTTPTTTSSTTTTHTTTTPTTTTPTTTTPTTTTTTPTTTTTTTTKPPFKCLLGQIVIVVGGISKCLNSDALKKETTTLPPTTTVSTTLPTTTTTLATTTRPIIRTTTSEEIFCPQGQERVKKMWGYVCRYKPQIQRKCPDGMQLMYEHAGPVCRFVTPKPTCPTGSRIVITPDGKECQKIPQTLNGRSQRCQENHMLVKMPTGFTCLRLQDTGSRLNCPSGLLLIHKKHYFECRVPETTSKPSKCSRGQIAYSRGQYTICINEGSFRIVSSLDLGCGPRDVAVMTPAGDVCISVDDLLPIVSYIVAFKHHPHRNRRCQFSEVYQWIGDRYVCRVFRSKNGDSCPKDFRLVWKNKEFGFLCVNVRESKAVDPWTRKPVNIYDKSDTKTNVRCPYGLVLVKIKGGVTCAYPKSSSNSSKCTNCSKRENGGNQNSKTTPRPICPSGLISVRTKHGVECQYPAKSKRCPDKIGHKTPSGNCNGNNKLGCYKGHNFIGKSCGGQQNINGPNMNVGANVPRRRVIVGRRYPCQGNAFQRIVCERNQMNRFQPVYNGKLCNSNGAEQRNGCKKSKSLKRIDAPKCRKGFVALRSVKGPLCVPNVTNNICSPSVVRNAVIRNRPGCGIIHKRYHPIALCSFKENTLCEVLTRPMMPRNVQLSRSNCKAGRVAVRAPNGTLCLPESRGFVSDRDLRGSCRVGETLVRQGKRYVCVARPKACDPKCAANSRCVNGECVCESGLSGPNCDLDVNECYRYKPCSHTCQNTHRGYICLCPDGSVLGDDRHTCRKETH